MNAIISESDIERRAFGTDVEVRDIGGKPTIAGYAAVFDQWSDDMGGYIERVLPGFFADVLGQDVRALWQHDPQYVLGRTTNGTLEMQEDEHGLAYRITPPDTQWARDAMVSIQRGDVNQASFGFTVREHRMEPRQGGLMRRTLIKAKQLLDLSPVTYPAYPQTSAQVRAMVAELRAQLPPEDEPAGDRGRDDNLRAWYELKQLEVSNG